MEPKLTLPSDSKLRPSDGNLREPERVLQGAHRILAPGGSLIIIYRSAAVDPILRVIDWIGSVGPESGFDQHQPRIPTPALVVLLATVGFEKISHRKFELGLNNLLVAFNPSPDQPGAAARPARG